MSEEREVIEKGIIISRRKVIDLGGSKAVTLPAKWLDIQRWLGKEVDEFVSVADNLILLVPPEKEKLAIRILKKLEEEMET